MRAAARIGLLFLLGISALLTAGEQARFAGSFLRLGTTARSQAMGGAFTAELDRSFTAYHNPAGVAFLESRRIGFTHHFLPLNRRLSATSFATGLAPTAGLGVAWVSAGVDRIDGRNDAGEHTQYLSTREDAIYFSFAQRLNPRFSLGVSVKILYQQLPLNSSQVGGKGVGFDVGLMFRPERGAVLALMAQDLGSNYQWKTDKVLDKGGIYRESFPTRYRLGTAFDYRDVRVVADLGLVRGAREVLGYSLRVGTEYRYREHYYLRGGFGNARLAFGGGINWSFRDRNDAVLDYAFVLEAPAGGAHVFTYAWRF